MSARAVAASIAALVAVLLGLVGCTGDDGETGATTSSTTTASTLPAPAAGGVAYRDPDAEFTATFVARPDRSETTVPAADVQVQRRTYRARSTTIEQSVAVNVFPFSPGNAEVVLRETAEGVAAAYGAFDSYGEVEGLAARDFHLVGDDDQVYGRVLLDGRRLFVVLTVADRRDDDAAGVHARLVDSLRILPDPTATTTSAPATPNAPGTPNAPATTGAPASGAVPGDEG